MKHPNKENYYKSLIEDYREACFNCNERYNQQIKDLAKLISETPEGWLNNQYKSEIIKFQNKIESYKEMIGIFNEILTRAANEIEQDEENI